VRVLGFLVISLALSLPAVADDARAPNKCFDRTIVINRVLTVSPGSQVRYDLVGNEAEAFLAGFNAVPPPSIYTADEILIFTTPQLPAAYWMILLQNCCATYRGKSAVGKAERLIASAQGI
jgi:hypothetical protein